MPENNDECQTIYFKYLLSVNVWLAIGMTVIYSLWWWCECLNAYKNVTTFVVYWVDRINGSSLSFCRNYLIKISFVNAVQKEMVSVFSCCDCIVHSFVSSEHSGTDFWVVYDSWNWNWLAIVRSEPYLAQNRRKLRTEYEILLIMEWKNEKQQFE